MDRLTRMHPPHIQGYIDRACQQTLEHLAGEALGEERTLQRLQRFFSRATEHAYYSPCGDGQHNPWTFFSDYEVLSWQHDWTLRILRRARRAQTRTRQGKNRTSRGTVF